MTIHTDNLRSLRRVASYSPRYRNAINRFIDTIAVVLPGHRIVSSAETWNDDTLSYGMTAKLTKNRESRADAALRMLITNTLERETNFPDTGGNF